MEYARRYQYHFIGITANQLRITAMIDIIEEASKVYNDGGLILYPSDTIWGIGCDPFNEAALDRLLKLKHRDSNKPFILLVKDVKMLKEYLTSLHPRIETLLSYHRRPLTIVYNNPENLPKSILAKDGTIAIRVTTDPFCKHFIEKIDKPLVSTSANITGQPFPENYNAISAEIIQGVDYVVNIRQDEDKSVEPSVMASVNANGELEFLRT